MPRRALWVLQVALLGLALTVLFGAWRSPRPALLVGVPVLCALAALGALRWGRGPIARGRRTPGYAAGGVAIVLLALLGIPVLLSGPSQPTALLVADLMMLVAGALQIPIGLLGGDAGGRR
ncbi:hypothetical protein [Micromonospora siamensis]|uniref:Uncharacterized protein n=1 Tax=Micromonospora siamensis TaxID=299152 RepID=A0A1C5JX84_9ACTN|nr:hypothetical protein [Micromonospora siamensis]SCG75190.1 hypothetical protein GA0074704_5135 [Micromonospora siamensis]